MLLAVLMLLPLLASCSTSTRVVQMDTSLIAPCDKPYREGDTWRDIAIGYKKRGTAIDECNLRLNKARTLSK